MDKDTLQTIKTRVLGNMGTTIAGVSLHYDLLIQGFVTKDYPTLGKGIISVLAFALSEDPFKNRDNTSSTTNQQV